MLKNKQLIGYIFYFYFAIIIPFILNTCKSYDFETELRQIDTLISLNNSAKESLTIDSDEIRARIDSMEYYLNFIQTLNPNKLSAELKFDLTKYQGILKIYSEFANKYDVMEYDNLDHSEFLKELKDKLLEKKISKEDFKLIYIEKRKTIINHLNEIIILVNKIYSVEEIFIRIHTKLVSFYNNFEKKTTTNR